MAQPAQGMPPAAIFAPDVYAQQLKLDRQRKLADLLQQQAMESPQGQMVSGHYIAPSATQHLARLAAIVGGNYINSKLDESQAKVSKEYGRAMAGQIDNMFGGDSQPAYIEKGSDWQPAPATTSPSASVPPPQIDRLRNAAKAAYLMGNTDLANKLIGNMLELTNDQKNMAAMGQDPFEMGRLGMAKARKEGIMEMQPGARAVDLATGVSVFNPKVAEGITLDANGFASQVPGYAAANAGIQGAQTQAQEQAKAGMDMVTINTPNGPMMVTRAQAAQMANPSPTQNIQFKGSNADLDLQGMSPDRAAQMAEGIKDPAEKARFLSTLGQWASQKQEQGIPLQGNAGASFETGQGKFFSDTYADLQKGAMTANRNIANLNRMSQLMEGVSTGKLAPTGAQISALGESFGVKIDPKLGNKQALEALSNEMALALRNPSGGAGMPGAMSDSDREYLRAMVPSLSRTPEGNKIMIEAGLKLAKREQEVADLARKYVAKNGQLNNGFYQELQNFSNQNPLFSSANNIHAQAAAILSGGK